MTNDALKGMRVIDLTSGPAGGIATMILADFGAAVLTIERPASDRFALLPAAPMWRRGKRLERIDLDTDDGLASLDALCAGADVLVCNWRASALKRKGLEFAALHARHPHLVYCHISGFGSHGPLADYPGYEHVVAAYTGRMRVFAGITDRSGPVFSALQLGIHAAAQAATTGILAALLDRGEDGVGRLVETSILQGMLTYEQGPMIGRQFEQLVPMSHALQPITEEPEMPSLYYHPAQAADGRWVQFGNLLPHLFDNFLIATGLIDIVADPDWNATQMMLPPEKQNAFRARLLSRIQQRPADDWMADFIADGGIAATRYQTTQDALADPDIVANGHVIPREDGGVQLGPVARLSKTPAQPGPPAAQDEGLADAWRTSPRPRPTRTGNRQLPLAGIRVVELATIIAAPLGASFLADMGADVIKVEQIGGDPYRGLALGIGSARVNAGKRSISVDLKSDAGKKIVLELIKDADVLIHNFRPGVPERLGVGYDDLAVINPRIVYLQSNGYGPDGPGAKRPSTHPIPGAAMGGAMFQMRERVPSDVQDLDGLILWTRRLMRANDVSPDPSTACVVTTSVMLGLAARQRTGQGQQILVDMFGANAYANHDDFLCYPGKPHRTLADELMYGTSPTYRLYPTGGEQWVFLALTSDKEIDGFIDALAGEGIDAPARAVLRGNDSATVDALTSLFAARDADFWQALLGGAGIGCVRADGDPPGLFWLQDPQVQALGLTIATEHPSWGPYRRHGPTVIFDGKPQPLGPPPLPGEHNAELLAGEGYGADEIAELTAAGILYSET